MGDYHVPEMLCPRCGHKLDAATPVYHDERGPIEGDITICIHCWFPLVYEKGMTLRILSMEEIGKLPHDVVVSIVRAVGALMQAKMTHEEEMRRGSAYSEN